MSSRNLERLLIVMIGFCIVSFAYYFTNADIEEVQARFSHRRTVFLKSLAREAGEIIRRGCELTPRLENFLVEEDVAYAIVQLSSGEIIAKAVNEPISAGMLREAEKIALGLSHLNLFDFKDSSDTVFLVEAAMPKVVENYGKVVIRLGFFRDEETQSIIHVRFRNLFFFTLISLCLLVYWFVRHKNSYSFQATLVGGCSIVVLLMFFATRLSLQEWFDQSWRDVFVRHGMATARLAALPSQWFLETGDETKLREYHALLERDDSFNFLAVIQNEKYLYHSDPELQGEIVTDDQNYLKSLISESPILFRIGKTNFYEVFVPLFKGNHRLGTAKIGFRSTNGLRALNVIRNQIILIYIGGFILLFSINHLIGRRVKMELTWIISALENVTAGNLRQKIFIERDDEFGQLAHSFNFMIMSLKERDFLGRGLQQYVSKSIVEKTLKVISVNDITGEKGFCISIMVHFSDLAEGINISGSSRFLSHVKEVYNTIRSVCPENGKAKVHVQLTGFLILFGPGDRHSVVMRAVTTSQLLLGALLKLTDLPFAPRLTLHSFDAVQGTIDDHHAVQACFGEGTIDFASFAQVQGSDEIIFSESAWFLLKDISEFEEIEISSGGDGGRLRAHIFRGFLPVEDLVRAFPGSANWARVLILKILRDNASDSLFKELCGWFDGAEGTVRFHILEVLEIMKVPGIESFIVKIVELDSDPKVLAKAIMILGKIGNESHVPVLAEKLRVEDRRVRANTIEALESIGGKKVYEFFNLLLDEPDNRVKANILIALGKYGDLKVFQLLSCMIKDSDPTMRASAAYALGRLGKAQGVEPLVEALSDKEPSVRRQVVSSLTALKADLEID